ncbi:MAG TPA: hypothetical protein ENN55_02160 [Firmicutes bacterium]|nr:hypothetical protein [Bacillota bacterium]
MNENLLAEKLEILEKMLENARRQKDFLTERKITETVSLDEEKNRMLAGLTEITGRIAVSEVKDIKNNETMRKINLVLEELMKQERENQNIISGMIDAGSDDFIRRYKQFEKGGSDL